jgi:hypothetical protein
MDGEFHGNAAGLANALADALGDRSLPVWAMPMIGLPD